MREVQPIRDLKDIAKMKEELAKYSDRDCMLFTFGINCGLRVSDLLTLRVSDVSGDHVIVTEKKTGKINRFPINAKLRKALRKYIKDNNLTDNDYLFQSRKGENKPITRVQAWRVLNRAADYLNLDEIGTHTMRKTYGYHFYQRTHDIALLQEMFNHSAPSITLRYIGINAEMRDNAMKDFYL